MRNQNLNPKNSNANVRAISDSLGEKVNRRKLVDSFQHYLRQECGLDARSIPMTNCLPSWKPSDYAALPRREAQCSKHDCARRGIIRDAALWQASCRVYGRA